ncbi:hypothetical protein AKJ42_03125 [candidate division MSBL1 archaeon SCGC-AAA261C02]|uniref:Uncharacterized protein n=1 Tax=candidate division MSBL1 archaeon SCGC-AAA261C02 TaxID=1698272 RepID=A0A133UZ88_9EURY|nr:hypothetical protein AKJ42_03125 [candidate division MSBL1 archaeon SCGC-AAA261C02]
MQTTIRGKIFPSEDQAEKLDELMRIQSSCMRYSYNRLCECAQSPGAFMEPVEPDRKSRPLQGGGAHAPEPIP